MNLDVDRLDDLLGSGHEGVVIDFLLVARRKIQQGDYIRFQTQTEDDIKLRGKIATVELFDEWVQKKQSFAFQDIFAKLQAKLNGA